jgi:hypothetical protein
MVVTPTASMAHVGRDHRCNQIGQPLMDMSHLGRYNCNPGFTGPRFKTTSTRFEAPPRINALRCRRTQQERTLVPGDIHGCYAIDAEICATALRRGTSPRVWRDIGGRFDCRRWRFSPRWRRCSPTTFSFGCSKSKQMCRGDVAGARHWTDYTLPGWTMEVPVARARPCDACMVSQKISYAK